MTVLAADIGGTSARFALFEPAGRRLLCSETYLTGDWPGASEIARTFLTAYRASPAGACIAVAGPVRRGRSERVNIGWAVDASRLAEELGIPAVSVVNDLEANARGIALLGADDLAVLNRGEPDPGGNRVVVSAGTGLGEAALVRHGARYVALAGEGGHADFAPRTEVEIALFRYLAAEHRHVSYERVCSGAGLVNIYRFLRDAGRGAVPDWFDARAPLPTPAEISAEAAAEPRGRAAAALRLFSSIYGARAGNVALSFLATGGVYLGGGIAPRNLGALTDGSFMAAFTGKGRMSMLVEDIPVFVVLNDRTALFGAADIAAELVEPPAARLVAA
jgi:glucokinase